MHELEAQVEHCHAAVRSGQHADERMLRRIISSVRSTSTAFLRPLVSTGALVRGPAAPPPGAGVRRPSGDKITGGYRLASWYAQRGFTSVLWLEHLTSSGLSDLATAVGSSPIPDRVSIIVTTADTDWPHTLPAPARSLWGAARHLDVGALTDAEEAALRNEPRLAAVVPALDAGERLLGRLVVARGPGPAGPS